MDEEAEIDRSVLERFLDECLYGYVYNFFDEEYHAIIEFYLERDDTDLVLQLYDKQCALKKKYPPT